MESLDKIINNFTKLIRNAQRQKIINMLIGVTGVYIFYWINGYLHENMTKQQYINDSTGQKQKFVYPISFIIYPSMFAWILGRIINCRNPQVHHIPAAKAAKAASMTVISQIVVNIAIYLIDYPTSVMFKSCTIISVLAVAIFCSKIKTKKLKLTPKKFITGGIITLGIILYSVFRCPQQKSKDIQQKTSQQSVFTLWYFLGIILLVVSLFADGFLPDFQAQIKQKYNPRPLQMYEQMNKWTVIWCVIVEILYKGQLYPMTLFLFTHHQAGIQMFFKALTGAIGQMFIYKLIKDFKQHIVPFVVTTRKILSAAFSILLFNHCVTLLQKIAIFMVFLTVFIQFLIEVGSDNDQNNKDKIERSQLRQEISQNFVQTKQKNEFSPQILNEENNNKVQNQISNNAQQLENNNYQINTSDAIQSIDSQVKQID